MSEVTSGQKSNISAVNYLQGNKLRSDFKTRMSGLRQIDHGFHFINTATTVLEGIQNQLEELNSQLPSLRYANSATLQSAQVMYKEVIQRVIYTLKDSQFNGKSLFDGSFADSSKADVSHLIPGDASPLSVRYGEDRDEVINILIPRLLPGDGRRDNPAVTDAFMPLFSVTENAYKALEALEGVRDVVAGALREKIYKSIIWIYSWNECKITFSFYLNAGKSMIFILCLSAHSPKKNKSGIRLEG